MSGFFIIGIPLEPEASMFFNGCFNWMFPTCYMENGWDIIKHPSVSSYWFFGLPVWNKSQKTWDLGFVKPIVNKGQKLLYVLIQPHS